MDGREMAGGATASKDFEAISSQTKQVASVPRSPQFSVMLWVLGKQMSMEQRLETVAAAGYTAGELVREWVTWTPAERQRIVAKKDALGLTFDLMFPSVSGLTDASAHAKMADEIRAAVPLAREIGCTQFSFRSGSRVPGRSPEQERQTIVDALKIASDICQGERIDMLLEPIDNLEAKNEAVKSALDGFAIVKLVGNPDLRVLYDFYHEQRDSGNLIEKLDGNIDRVGVVHIADVPGRYRPGTGEMNYSNIYRKLAALHYRRTIAMEFYPQGEPVAELKEARLEAEAAMRSA
ncbi:MAG: TIM barrel protein [Janthinobacterium lividum]